MKIRNHFMKFVIIILIILHNTNHDFKILCKKGAEIYMLCWKQDITMDVIDFKSLLFNTDITKSVYRDGLFEIYDRTSEEITADQLNAVHLLQTAFSKTMITA